MRDSPIVLRTLGTVDLIGPADGVRARVLSQPKRLGVLAYLAARPTGERVSRDRVIVTFWPELPTERARAGLRNALHFLRAALGRDAIVARGHTLAVDPAYLCSDASELLATESAGAAGQVSPTAAAERRLDLYGGEFLDGLHVSEAPDFERWVDRTRAAVRRRATELAWMLSGAAERRGEWITAAAFARRGTELAVDVEGASQQLIRLLDRAGDRAAALAEFERISVCLESAYGVPPSPETVALVDRVRERDRPSDIGGVTESGPPPDGPRGGAGPRYRSLAVLPFEDLDGAGSFGPGLTDDLLTALSRLRDVRIVSRTSVQGFAKARPESMRKVHEVLGVDVVVEGSVRTAGDRVRIVVRLVDAFRDAHIWAQTYDVGPDELLDVQSDIALRVARALDIELSPRDHQRLRNPPTRSVEAYRLYLEARVLWARRSPAAAQRSAELFERALERDPDLVGAWAGLADAHLLIASVVPGMAAHSLRRARKALERALEMDPDSGEANATRGLIQIFIDWDLRSADRHLGRAVEASPGYATAHQWYGQWLAAAGEVERGLAEVAVALDLDPLSPAVREAQGLALYHAGRIQQALEQFRKTWELDPTYARAPLGLALCHAALGARERVAHSMVSAWGLGAGGGCREEVADVLAGSSDPDGTLRAMRDLVGPRASDVVTHRMVDVLLSMMLADHERALASLRMARLEGSLGFMILHAPALDPLNGDARFGTLMDEAGLRLPRWRPVQGFGTGSRRATEA